MRSSGPLRLTYILLREDASYRLHQEDDEQVNQISEKAI